MTVYTKVNAINAYAMFTQWLDNNKNIHRYTYEVENISDAKRYVFDEQLSVIFHFGTDEAHVFVPQGYYDLVGFEFESDGTVMEIVELVSSILTRRHLTSIKTSSE